RHRLAWSSGAGCFRSQTVVRRTFAPGLEVSRLHSNGLRGQTGPQPGVIQGIYEMGGVRRSPEWSAAVVSKKEIKKFRSTLWTSAARVVIVSPQVDHRSLWTLRRE